MNIFEKINKLSSQCEHCTDHLSPFSFKENGNVNFEVFNDGDILHYQDLIDGSGQYIDAGLDEHHQYWKTDTPAFLFSFHDAEENQDYPYLGIHAFESEAQAKQVATEYSGHHFIILAKSDGSLECLHDDINIEETMNNEQWIDIVRHLANNHSYINLMVASKIKPYNHLELDDALDSDDRAENLQVDFYQDPAGNIYGHQAMQERLLFIPIATSVGKNKESRQEIVNQFNKCVTTKEFDINFDTLIKLESLQPTKIDNEISAQYSELDPSTMSLD